MAFSIKRMTLGQLMTNCYIVSSGTSAAVIDPAANAEKIIEVCEKEGFTIEAILLTHGHFDHTGALKELKERTGAKVYIHQDDCPMLGDNEKNLAFMTGEKQERTEPDVILQGGEEILIGGEKLTVIHTPGHSAGSVTYVCDGAVFSGDLIFKGSVGRYDYGSYSDEMRSIRLLCAVMEDDVAICPGHGEVTDFKTEKKYNPYF